jgi:hypothetical protein
MMFLVFFNVFFILMCFFFFILIFQMIHNHQIEALNERVTVKKIGNPLSHVSEQNAALILSNTITAYIHEV